MSETRAYHHCRAKAETRQWSPVNVRNVEDMRHSALSMMVEPTIRPKIEFQS